MTLREAERRNRRAAHEVAARLTTLAENPSHHH